MARTTLTSKGQITLPKEIRQQLGLKAGVRFECYVDRDGQVVLVPLTVKLEDLIGILPHKGPPKTVEEINEAIAEAAIERATRGLEGT
ncbi:MAG TPA: AbrB/MazE/SpoVT family DNA-binding domain-containing protein [Geminicoccaceae bacterium]|nr:AbrB/MazE/SpoVT family DNA-binding domain-containing protein [Geminicoccaceae bacterium]